MHLVKPSFKLLIPDLYDVWAARTLQRIEIIGRTCYDSSSKITLTSAADFVRMIIKRGHESVIEHESLSVRFIVDRGVTHEMVRHRLASYSQRSTRYCNENTGKGIEVITPFLFDPYEELQEVSVPTITPRWGPRDSFGGLKLTMKPKSIFHMNSFDVWFLTCLWTEWGYTTLINQFKRTPQEARSVLPNSLRTEIVMTANLREWRHVFKLRCAKAAHPQMREIMTPLRDKMIELLPTVFEDLKPILPDYEP